MTVPTPKGNRQTLTVLEAAGMLGLCVDKTYQAVREGRIPAIRIGDRWFVLKKPFERMLQGNAA
jgi:excisionase family DNA binding protein